MQTMSPGFLGKNQYETISVSKKSREFSVLDWADVRAWWSADDIELGDGVILRADGVTPTATDDVINLIDKTGNGNDASAIINGIIPPKYIASDVNFNNKPSIDLTGNAQCRFECPAMNYSSNVYTIILVCKPNSTALANQDAFYSRNSGAAILAAFNNRTTTNQYAYFDSALRGVGGTPSTAPKIIEWELDSNLNVGTVRVNNVVVGSSTFSTRAINTAIGILGRPQAAGGGERFNGYFREMIFAVGKLDAATRAALYGIL
jgi:hypothetical protein